MSTYSKKHDALFIHIPKTAGTSMERALFGGGGHEPVSYFNVDKSTFKFAFVRHPLDRFVSAFFCRDFLAGFENNIQGMNRYIEYISMRTPDEFPDAFVFHQHFKPMYHFVLDENGDMGVDFIGRFENLERDWEYVCDMLGEFKPLPHHRKNDHPHYTECFEPANKQYIINLYAKDFELFNYDKA